MADAQVRHALRPWAKVALLVVVFLAALLPRVIYPVSRPAQWYTRSVMFIDRVLEGAWGETVYSEHPGVTTMWLSGIALRLAGEVPEERLGGPYVAPESLTARESAIGVAPLALAIALLTVLAYRLLARLFDDGIALAGALLVALDPFYVANSKVLHVDGLLAAFSCAAALAMLVYVRERRWRWVVLSGILSGLALLTKAPALFLVPYAGLALLVGLIVNRGAAWRRDLLAGLLWLAVLVVAYCALFPAMWVAPLQTLRTVYSSALYRVGQAHPSPIYVAGRVILGDPGPGYYLATWAFKVTAVVAVFAVLGLVYSLSPSRWTRGQRVTIWMVLAFVVFFTVQMMLGAKKMPRYLLPAWPMADILGGLGLVAWARGLARCRVRGRALRRADAVPHISTALTVCGLLVQAALILPRHPYYDTYFSELAGGARAGVAELCTQWQGEGLDLAAERLNELPNARQQTVASQRAILFRQYFAGQTVDVDVEVPADWVVLGVHDVLRGGDEGEEQAVDFYRRREAHEIIRFDSIPYVWVHPAATAPQRAAAVDIETGVRLIGFDIPTDGYHPGETIRLQLYWRAQERLPEDYVAFVHLLDSTGRLIAQQDNPPVRGTRPTSTWEPGDVIVDPYDIVIPAAARPGEYTIAAGMYRWPDVTRLQARDATGALLADNRVLLTTLSIQPQRPAAGVWIARAVALLVMGLGVLAARPTGDADGRTG